MTKAVTQLSDSITCHGISVRTSNLAETREQTAKLGGLWQRFYQTKLNQLSDGESVFGVYHNYERDDTGEFDVVAAWQEGSCDVTTGDKDELVTVTIPAGRYIVISEKGPMPDTVIEAWEKVWSYFNDPSCPHQRTFEVDFEQYVHGNLEFGQVDLYIGIK